MKETWMMKCLVVFIIISLVSITIVQPVNVDANTLVTAKRKNFEVNPTVNPYDLPDLVITKIFTRFHLDDNLKLVKRPVCNVKNIGASVFDLFVIEIDVVCEIYNFSSKSFEVYDTYGAALESHYGFFYGESFNFTFSSDIIHPYGIIRFRGHTHFSFPDEQEESDSTNNNRSQIFYHPRNLVWIPIGNITFDLFVFLQYLFWGTVL